MKTLKLKILSLLGLMAMGTTATYAIQTNSVKMNGRLKVTTLSPDEIRYTGKPYNKELGAYVFNSRNYDPQTSRWTTLDPTGYPDGANNRIYSLSPLNSFDPTGARNVTYTFTQSSKWLNDTGGATLLGAGVGAGLGGALTYFTGGLGAASIPIATSFIGGFAGWALGGDYQMTAWVTNDGSTPPEPEDGEYLASTSTPTIVPGATTVLNDALLATEEQHLQTVTVVYDFEE